MFSLEVKEKLIKELNIQLENKEFYSVDDDVALPSNIFEDLENISAPNYAKLASITGDELEKPQNNLKTVYNLTNEYCESNNFKSVGLYRPLINSEFNPLDKTVYNYKATYAAPIHGMAFMKNDGGIIENTISNLYNIVDNTNIFNKYNSLRNYEKFDVNAIIKDEIIEDDSSKIPVKSIAYNTYQMSDILETTQESQILNFKEIPKELALTKPSKWKSFWFQEINITDTIKNIFSKRKGYSKV